MAAHDTAAQVTAWALDEASRQCLGQDYHVAVTWAPAMIQGPQGPAQLPVWQLLITCRNPLLGQPPLFHMVPVAPVKPEEKQVRDAVADGLRELRELAARMLAGANGHPKVPA